MTFLAAFAVYLATLCPTIYVGDSGELVTAAYTLGIAHPTGYPLYLLAVKAFASVAPVGSVALRANLFSALCTALAAQILAMSVRRLGGSKLAGLGAGLALAFFAPVWEQATVARVYALSALFAAALLWCMVRWWQDGGRGLWWRFGLLLGLGLASHTMLVAFVPALAVLMLLRRPRALLDVRGILVAGLCLLPGLGLYAYLPVRAAAHPALDWRVKTGEDETASFVSLTSVDAVRAYLTREMHHERRWARDLDDARVVATHHARSAARELGVAGILLFLVGAVSLIRRGGAGLLIAALLLWALNVFLLGWHGAWWDVFLYPRYVTVGWVALLLVVGAGLAEIVGAVRTRSSVRWFAAPLALAYPVLLLVLHHGRCDRSDHTLAEDYARALFAELPDNAQVLSTVDTALYPMLYLQQVEGLRPDVEFVNPLHFETKADLAQRLPQARPLFTTDPPLGGVLGTYPRFHVGLMDRIRPPGEGEWTPPPLVEPALGDLQDTTNLDSFSVSLVAQIEANLAEAMFERGDVEGARRRLQRVRDLPAGRPWGAFAGVELCLRMGEPALGLELLDVAARRGNPREPALEGLRGQLERLHKGLESLARANASTDADQQLRELEKAARQARRFLPAQRRLAEALLLNGRKQEAVGAADAAYRQNPTDPAMLRLRQEIMRLAGG